MAILLISIIKPLTNKLINHNKQKPIMELMRKCLSIT